MYVIRDDLVPRTGTCLVGDNSILLKDYRRKSEIGTEAEIHHAWSIEMLFLCNNTCWFIVYILYSSKYYNPRKWHENAYTAGGDFFAGHMAASGRCVWREDSKTN